MIFALPPAGVAIHPAAESGRHEIHLLCGDLKAEMAAFAKRGTACSEVQELSWGTLTRIRLPGGGEIGLYQPKHPSPKRPE